MLSRRIVLVRAVNVGGAKLPMSDLRELAEELGASDVSTYIASGNLLCTPPVDNSPASFDQALGAAIEERFGYHREVISRSVEQLSQALAAHPFDVVDDRFSYIHFLVATPTPDRSEVLAEKAVGAEQVAVIGSDVHIRYPHGAGQSKLTAATLVRTLGVQGTARNLRTVRTLIDLARQ